MYLDINDSTSIAEKLGDKLFIQYIQDFFLDIASIIDETKGSVYEYVGDEVVITWNYQNGIKQENCLRTFEMFKIIFNENAEYYQKKYGFVPSFKASLHVGDLMVAALGLNKIFVKMRGAALNIGARIIAQCHQLHHNFLISAEVVQEFSKQSKFTFKQLGEYELKGVSKKVGIYILNTDNKQT